jgi:hypothetical protein
MLRNTKEKFAAYHEAGHCIGHLVTGIIFESVDILPEYNCDGKCVTRGKVTQAKIQQNFSKYDLLIVLYAGFISEAKYRNYPLFLCEILTSANSSPEYKYANEILDNCIAIGYLSSKGKLRGDIKQKTRNYVNLHWNLIEAIANALLERKKLMYQDVLKIVQSLS